jgi:hypothetical protein
MWEKIIATISFAFVLWMFAQTWRYFRLTWFRSSEYLQQLRSDQPEWIKNFRLISNFRNSPYALITGRLITAFCFLLAILMFIFAGWALLVTWFEFR